MPELHETHMGVKLIEGTLPEIGKQLKRIADTMEKATSDIDAKKAIEFLEYEEALTKDPKTATRIALLLKELKIWN